MSVCSGIFHKDFIVKRVLIVLIVTKTNTNSEPSLSTWFLSHTLSALLLSAATYESSVQVNKVF